MFLGMHIIAEHQQLRESSLNKITDVTIDLFKDPVRLISVSTFMEHIHVHFAQLPPFVAPGGMLR